MNQKILKIGMLSLFLSLGLVLSNCQKDDGITASANKAITVEDATTIAAADEVSEGVSDLAEQLYVEDGLTANKMEYNSYFSGLCGGMMASYDKTQMNRMVSFNFGAAGCLLPNNDFVKGKITTEFSADRTLKTHTINVTFEGFFYNDKQVSGTVTIERVAQNANGNPQSTITADIKITFADGTYIERKSVKVREMIEGKDTIRDWGDNVFLITGHWTTVFRNGDIHSGEIIIPLRREMSCRFIVSGSIQFKRNDRTGTLDYGDGTCENKATFTNDEGVVKEIELGTR